MEKIENVLQDITSYFLYQEVMPVLLLQKYFIFKRAPTVVMYVQAQRTFITMWFVKAHEGQKKMPNRVAARKKP